MVMKSFKLFHTSCAQAQMIIREAVNVSEQTEVKIESSSPSNRKRMELPILRPLTVRVSPEGLSGVNLTVDNAPFQNGDMLDRDRTHVICASAQNYQNHCQRVHLQHEQDTLHIGLVELPRLIPDIIPMTVPHSVTVDGVQSSQWPMHIQSGREYVVCAASADGHEATPRCHRVNQSDGEARPRFALSL